MNKLLAVGTIAFDEIESRYGSSGRVLGGAATYIGLAASHFDVDCGLVSVIGGDFPDEYLQLLRDRNINLDGVEIKQDGKSFFWKGKYHDDMNGRDTLVTELNVLESFDPVVPDQYKESDVLLLGNLHPGVQIGVMDQMTSKPLVILDTMNFWMDITMDLLKEAIKRVDVITINDEEARQLSGEYSLVLAARKIHEMGPKYVVIKKGEHGALLFHEDKKFFAPALPLEQVYDPTGAGDTFAGGFAGYLASTGDYSFENMKRALIIGSNLASFVVEKFGTERTVSLESSEVSERLNEFKTLTAFQL